MGFIILLFTIVFIVWPIIAFVKMDKDIWVKELMVCGGTILLLMLIYSAIGSHNFGGGVWDGLVNAFYRSYYQIRVLCIEAILGVEFMLSLFIGKKLSCKLDRERNMCGTYQHSEVPPMPDNTSDNSNTADEGNTDMK